MCSAGHSYLKNKRTSDLWWTNYVIVVDCLSTASHILYLSYVFQLIQYMFDKMVTKNITVLMVYLLINCW